MEIKIPDSGVFRISASAGSGKTHSLTRLFVSRMLREKNAFKGMLAITFTNKAANELRERILKRLHELSNPEKPAKEENLFGFKDRQTLAHAASEVLKSVLHQSEFLQVGTIDSFFQQVFANLAIELGLPPGLSTEINLQGIKSEMLQEGLDRKNPEVLRILTENLSRQLLDFGKDWRTVPYLQKNLVSAVFDEPVVSLFLSGNTSALSEENLNKAADVLREYARTIRFEVQESASCLRQKLMQFGVRPDTLDKDSEMPFFKELEKIWQAAEGKVIPNPIVNHSQKGTFHAKMRSRPFSPSEMAELQPLIIRYGESRNQQAMADITLAENLIRNLVSVRLLLYFRSVLQDLNRANNRFLLSEIKFLLAEFLSGSEVPYLFEKTGSKLHTLLIDEFQDTDKTQWKVLGALASVVVDNGGLFAVVGDVKQSIYGWRGADSSLFKSGLNRDLHPLPITEETLAWNFRSEDLVVEFNNWLFKNLAKDFSGHLLSSGQVVSDEKWRETIRMNYEDVHQNPDASRIRPGGGFTEVRVRQKPKSAQNGEDKGEGEEDENFPLAFNWLQAEIMRLQDAGFSSSDIAILVRTNKDAEAVIRVLDYARRSGPEGYDFSFSTAASGKASGQALFVFLVLLIRRGCGKDILPFELEQLKRLGIEIGLEEFFQASDWASVWLDYDFRERDLDGILQEQAMYFKLHELPSQQLMLLQFQELLSGYLREDAFRYPDFFAWWKEKSAQMDVPLSSGSSGIVVMTIHRSKGLDFGVVILPVFSTAQGDSKALHDAVFWAFDSKAPWDCHPLLRTKSSKSLLAGSLAEAYQEDVFSRATEALNTFYVACTRPRYGLIMDITMDYSLDMPEKALYRLPVKIASLLRDSASISFSEHEHSIDFDREGCLLRFQLGKMEKPALPEKKQTSDIIRSGRSVRPGILRFKPDTEKMLVSQRTGILVHRILEKTSAEYFWPEVLEEEKKSGQWEVDEIDRASAGIAALFEFPQVKDWFSGNWKSYPEQNLLSASGRLLRADRILLKGNQAVILDFKTGEISETHLIQLREYTETFRQASGMENTEGWLLSSSEKTIRQV